MLHHLKSIIPPPFFFLAKSDPLVASSMIDQIANINVNETSIYLTLIPHQNRSIHLKLIEGKQGIHLEQSGYSVGDIYLIVITSIFKI